MTVKKQMAQGAAWMIGARFSIRGLGFISTLILARLLVPADFGLVALATAFIASVDLLRTFSFDVALIQDQDAGREKYCAAWTLNLIFSILLGGLLLAIAKPAATFFNDPRLSSVVSLLTATVFLQGLENVGVVDFRKNLEFRKEFIFLMVRKLSGFLVTIPLALILRNYWALVAGILTSAIAGLIASYAMHGFRPSFGLRGVSELFHFSKWLFVNNILYFVRHRAADFVLGKYSGARAVGLYSVAYDISHLVTNELVAPINRAVFPGYAKMAKDSHALKTSYLQVMTVIAILAMPTATGIAVIADRLVPILLGDNWLPTIPLIQILAFSGAITILETNIGSAYIAMGRPRVLTGIFSIFAAIFLSALFILTPRFGATGAAWAALTAGILNIPVQIFMMKRHLNITMRDLFAVFFRPIAASATMYLVARVTSTLIGEPAHILAQVGALIALALIGVLSYCLTTFLFWHLAHRPVGPESYLLEKYTQKYR